MTIDNDIMTIDFESLMRWVEVRMEAQGLDMYEDKNQKLCNKISYEIECEIEQKLNKMALEIIAKNLN